MQDSSRTGRMGRWFRKAKVKGAGRDALRRSGQASGTKGAAEGQRHRWDVFRGSGQACGMGGAVERRRRWAPGRFGSALETDFQVTYRLVLSFRLGASIDIVTKSTQTSAHADSKSFTGSGSCGRWFDCAARASPGCSGGFGDPSREQDQILRESFRRSGREV